jgi:transposase
MHRSGRHRRSEQHRIKFLIVRTAYKCRAYPDQVQASVLNRTFGCIRVVWNRTLAWRCQNMARNRAVARAIGDCGWGIFRAMLEYKAAWYGRHVIVIDRWFPSSKLCSACGYVLADLGLKVRMWQCPSCGARHDRDVNAAKNILAAGLAVAGDNPGHACGADVRHPGPLGCGRPRNRNPRA